MQAASRLAGVTGLLLPVTRGLGGAADGDGAVRRSGISVPITTV